MFNPINKIEDAANGAKNLGSDAVSAAHKLASDAYNTGATAVKTGAKVTSDVSHLEFGDAFKDAAKGGAQVGKHVMRLADDQVNMVVAGAKVLNPIGGEALAIGHVALRSAQNMAVLDPIAGIANVSGKAVNAVTGAHLPTLELHVDTGADKYGVAGKAAEYAGGALGLIAPFAMTGGMMAGAEAAGTAGRGAKLGDALGERFALSAAKAGEAAPKSLSKEETDALFSRLTKEDGVFQFSKGRYEANLTKVDPKQFPDGVKVSTSENALYLDVPKDKWVHQFYMDGIKLPTGTVVADGKIVSAPGGELRLQTEYGTRVFREGDRITTSGGAAAKPNDYIIQRASTDDAGLARTDAYVQDEATMQRKWEPVEGNPGTFTPKIAGAAPAEMVRIPEGMNIKFKASYGEDVENSGPAWMVKDGDGHYIITERDLRETYVGATPSARTRMQEILDHADRIAGTPVPRAQHS